MSFFHLLRENGFDWDKTKEIFYNLTDLRVAWINAIVEKERKDAEKEAEKRDNSARAERRFGSGKAETHKKSFDLRD